MVTLLMATMATATTLILIDNSGSMGGSLPGGGSKADEAAKAFSDRLLPSISSEEPVGVWAFGGSCSPTLQLQRAPRTPASAASAALHQLGSPRGGTPLAISVDKALRALASSEEPRQLIVVTDGLDTCGGDPCAIVRARAAGTKVSVHTIGLGMGGRSGEFRTLQCMADASHEGTARTLEPGETAASLAGLIEDLGRRLEVPKGELLVRVRDAGGESQRGIAFIARDRDRGEEIRGMTGEPLVLPVGRYQVEVGTQVLGEARVRENRLSELEQVSDLGRLTIQSNCTQDTSFAILDSQGRTLSTGSLTQQASLDLPPGDYQVSRTQFAHVIPVPVTVHRGRTELLTLSPLGELVVDLEHTPPSALPVEVYDDAQTGGAGPVATGQSGEAFSLPAGTYNVRIAGEDGGRYRPRANVRIANCEPLRITLGQRSTLIVCGPGSGEYEIWRDSDGRLAHGTIGKEIPLEPALYNLRFSDGSSIPNVRVEHGTRRIRCP